MKSPVRIRRINNYLLDFDECVGMRFDQMEIQTDKHSLINFTR